MSYKPELKVDNKPIVELSDGERDLMKRERKAVHLATINLIKTFGVEQLRKIGIKQPI